MRRMKTAAGLLLVSSMLLPLRPSAQTGPPAMLKRTPFVFVSAVPGFTVRGIPSRAGAQIPLDAAVGPFPGVTLQSDIGGACRNRLQAWASGFVPLDPRASAAWRFEATPVSDDGEQVIFDMKLERRVPTAGRLLEGDHSETRRLTMRDGSRGILDLVRAAPGATGVCETFAIAVEVGYRSAHGDAEQAGLAYDLWLVDRGAPAAPPRQTRVEAGQATEIAYGFPPVVLNAASGEVRLYVTGALKGMARRDGLIDLVIDTTHGVSTEERNTSSGGRKRLAVRPGETIEFELPESLKAKLPDELRHHDFALRVTAERRW
jgi:hypothetical protein